MIACEESPMTHRLDNDNIPVRQGWFHRMFTDQIPVSYLVGHREVNGEIEAELDNGFKSCIQLDKDRGYWPHKDGFSVKQRTTLLNGWFSIFQLILKSYKLCLYCLVWSCYGPNCRRHFVCLTWSQAMLQKYHVYCRSRTFLHLDLYHTNWNITYITPSLSKIIFNKYISTISEADLVRINAKEAP